MKKYLYIFLFALLGVLSSCNGRDGRDGRDGKDGQDGFANIKNITFTVEPFGQTNGWGYSNLPDNNYFSAEIGVPELTKDIFDNGVVKVYRVFNDDPKNLVQQALPCTNHKEVFIQQNGETVTALYTETLDFQYAEGFVYLYYTLSDFAYEFDESTDVEPTRMSFRIVLMW
ncbi:MAG: hypothetical protein IJS73_01500 [Paludibacteraceae bacterium]|nr:hypothetical protein [Paludibacteraceae bacterium]